MPPALSVGNDAGIDRRVRRAGSGAGHEHAVAGACREPAGLAVGGERQVGSGFGARLAPGCGVLHATGRVDEGFLGRSLAAEQIGAGAVALVGDREQLVTQRPQLAGDAGPLRVAVACVAGRDHQLARALQQIVGAAERAFGLGHHNLARIDRALAGLGTADAGERPLGTRCRSRIVARLGDALAAGHLALQIREVGLAAREALDTGVVGVGGADAHLVGSGC